MRKFVGPEMLWDHLLPPMEAKHVALTAIATKEAIFRARARIKEPTWPSVARLNEAGHFLLYANYGPEEPRQCRFDEFLGVYLATLAPHQLGTLAPYADAPDF